VFSARVIAYSITPLTCAIFRSFKTFCMCGSTCTCNRTCLRTRTVFLFIIKSCLRTYYFLYF